MELIFDSVVIGAGLSGLVSAFKIKKSGRSVLLLEASARAGGVIRSEREQGFLLEFGPNTARLKPEIETLADELGILSEIQIADEKTPRYVQFGDALHPVPLSPFQLATTRLLSVSGRLELLREPFVSKYEGTREESVMNFGRRRFGDEAAERLIAPFVSGIWAGDPDLLSAAAAFPALVKLEQEHGSLLKAAFASLKNRKQKSEKRKHGLISFKNGFEVLSRALAIQLKDELKLGMNSVGIRLATDGTWEVETAKQTFHARELILAVPAWEAARLVRPFAPETSATLSNIPYAPLAVLHLGFDSKKIGNRSDGFGFLVAPSERSDILGCLWSSRLFDGRAPEGKTLLTVFMGGAANESILRETDTALILKAVEALRSSMKLSGPPLLSRVTRHDRAIPQYTLGHVERIRLLAETEGKFPGLKLKGSYRGGISVNDILTI